MLALAPPLEPFEFNPVAWVMQTPAEARALCFFELCAACGSRGAGPEASCGTDEGGGGGPPDAQLLHCADCGEGFHPFCLPVRLLPL